MGTRTHGILEGSPQSKEAPPVAPPVGILVDILVDSDILTATLLTQQDPVDMAIIRGRRHLCSRYMHLCPRHMHLCSRYPIHIRRRHSTRHVSYAPLTELD